MAMYSPFSMQPNHEISKACEEMLAALDKGDLQSVRGMVGQNLVPEIDAMYLMYANSKRLFGQNGLLNADNLKDNSAAAFDILSDTFKEVMDRGSYRGTSSSGKPVFDGMIESDATRDEGKKPRLHLIEGLQDTDNAKVLAYSLSAEHRALIVDTDTVRKLFDKIYGNPENRVACTERDLDKWRDLMVESALANGMNVVVMGERDHEHGMKILKNAAAAGYDCGVTYVDRDPSAFAKHMLMDSLESGNGVNVADVVMIPDRDPALVKFTSDVYNMNAVLGKSLVEIDVCRDDDSAGMQRFAIKTADRQDSAGMIKKMWDIMFGDPEHDHNTVMDLYDTSWQAIDGTLAGVAADTWEAACSDVVSVKSEIFDFVLPDKRIPQDINTRDDIKDLLNGRNNILRMPTPVDIAKPGKQAIQKDIFDKFVTTDKTMRVNLTVLWLDHAAVKAKMHDEIKKNGDRYIAPDPNAPGKSMIAGERPESLLMRMYRVNKIMDGNALVSSGNAVEAIDDFVNNHNNRSGKGRIMNLPSRADMLHAAYVLYERGDEGATDMLKSVCETIEAHAINSTTSNGVPKYAMNTNYGNPASVKATYEAYMRNIIEEDADAWCNARDMRISPVMSDTVKQMNAVTAYHDIETNPHKTIDKPRSEGKLEDTNQRSRAMQAAGENVKGSESYSHMQKVIEESTKENEFRTDELTGK